MSWQPLDISALGKVPRFDSVKAPASAAEEPATSTSARPMSADAPKEVEGSTGVPVPEKDAEPVQAEAAVAAPVDAQPAAAPSPPRGIARPPTPTLPPPTTTTTTTTTPTTTTTGSVTTALSAASMSGAPNSRAPQTPPTSGSSARRPDDPQPSTSSAIVAHSASSSSIHNGPAAAPTAAGPSPAAASSRLPPQPKSSPGHGHAHMSTGGKPQKPATAPASTIAPAPVKSETEMEVDELADSSGLSDPESSEDEGALQDRFPAASTSTATAIPSATPPGSLKKRPRESGAGGKGASAALEHFATADSPLPRYSIIRASAANKFNVIRINKGITDGDRARWPKPEECRKGYMVDNRPNWKEAIPLDEGRNKAARIAVGRMLASENMLNEKVKTAGGKDEPWILEDWPENYNFYLHHFRTKAGQDRDVDTYIFGTHAGPSFRTANEITPHIFWLLSHTTNDPKSCGCKFCSKKLQGDVNQVLGLISDHRGSPHASSSAPSSNKKPRIGASPIPSALSKVKKDKDPERKKKKHRLATGGSTGTHAPTYDGAYTDPMREQDLGEGALFRKAEMVWVDLSTPLLDGGGDPARALTRWPAIIIDRTTVSKATANDKGATGKAPQLVVTKSWQYSCRLLALMDSITRAESQIMPWLQYDSPMPNEPAAIIAPESVKLVYDGRNALRPSLKQITSVRLGATPYALSLQIAAHVLASFCLCDQYKLAESHLIALPGLSAADKAEMDKHVRRKHYHSMFWGAERIWNGELLRMLVDTAVTPSAAKLSPGASERSIFIKISGIYKDDETGSGSIAGVMYELADVAHVGAVGAPVAGGSAMSQFEKQRPGANPRPEDLFMPDAPPGYFFRRLTPLGEEIHLDIEYIAGRYYSLPVHLRVKETLDGILLSLAQSAVDPGPDGTAVDDYLDENSRAVVLAGLVPAYRTYMKCYTWAQTRSFAIKKAEEEARGEMSKYLNSATH